MDINLLRPIQQHLEIKMPDGSLTGIKFKLQGQDTKAFREAAKAFASKQMERRGGPVDLDEIEKQRIELACVCVVDWEGVEEPDTDGNLYNVPYTKAKAKELLSMSESSFIVEQIEEFVTQRANFFRSMPV